MALFLMSHCGIRTGHSFGLLQAIDGQELNRGTKSTVPVVAFTDEENLRMCSSGRLGAQCISPNPSPMRTDLT
jgi:hypothetical protein